MAETGLIIVSPLSDIAMFVGERGQWQARLGSDGLSAGFTFEVLSAGTPVGRGIER
jgi:hypothetical protein